MVKQSRVSQLEGQTEIKRDGKRQSKRERERKRKREGERERERERERSLLSLQIVRCKPGFLLWPHSREDVPLGQYHLS